MKDKKNTRIINILILQRTDVIELANHEAILAQAKEDMKVENAVAIRTAVEKERSDCMAKLDNELSLAREVVVEKNKEIEIYRLRTAALIEQGKRYKNMIDQLIGELESKSEIRQILKEKVLYYANYTWNNFKKNLI